MSRMRTVSDVIGMYATFSPSGNLIECMNVRTPADFWRIMGDRLDPTKYRVTTAPAKAGNVDQFIRQFGEDVITEMFRRETWDVTDARLKPWMLYVKENSRGSKTNTLSAGDLRGMARKGKSKGGGTNCFSGTPPKRTMTLAEFKEFVVTIPSTSKIEWQVTTHHPITYAFPTSDEGRKYIIREGNWILQVTPHSNSSGQWCEVKAIGTHASTWTNSYPAPPVEGPIGSGRHTTSIVNEGITIVPADNSDEGLLSMCNKVFETNALFAEFFNGDFHQFRKVRGMYHTSTSIEVTSKDPYRGAFIPIARDAGGSRFQFGPLKFRIDGKVYSVVRC